MRDDILQVRAPALNFYVLRDENGLYLIDSGFVGGQILLRRALRKRGWDGIPIRGIIVTHGHLDHILNTAALADRFRAWIAAPRLDARHYEGVYRYTGAAVVCGILEAAGRRLLRYRPFKVDRWMDDGTELPIWHGLTAVHLPGHTDGHMGLYCPSLRLLFSADLFASYGRIPHLPPPIFNSCPHRIPSSIQQALSLPLDGVLPNHGDRASPQEHLQRLRRLSRKMTGRA